MNIRKANLESQWGPELPWPSYNAVHSPKHPPKLKLASSANHSFSMDDDNYQKWKDNLKMNQTPTTNNNKSSVNTFLKDSFAEIGNKYNATEVTLIKPEVQSPPSGNESERLVNIQDLGKRKTGRTTVRSWEDENWNFQSNNMGEGGTNFGEGTRTKQARTESGTPRTLQLDIVFLVVCLLNLR